MSIDQIFTRDLLEPENRGEFISLLSSLPIPTRRSKQVYFEYLRLTDQVSDTHEIEEIIGGNNLGPTE